MPLFELTNEGFSNYRKPNFVSPLVLCLAVLVTALLVFCMCKKMGVGSEASGDCGVCTSAKAARNGVAATAGGVVEARDSSHLEELLQTSGGCVCLFWAPWCGHCNAFKPEYVAAAQEHTQMLYVMCDCENAVGPDTLQKHGIEAFPSVRFYRNGRLVHEYDGPREKAPLVAWASSK